MDKDFIQSIARFIVDGLNRLFMVPKIDNPYKQFTFTIADGAIQDIFYAFNYFRILTISATDGVTIRFGSSGTPTDVVGAGIGYEMPATVDRAQIINESGGTLTVTVALCVGRIDDDRLNVSGSITIAIPTQFISEDDVEVAVPGTAVEVLAANSARNEAIITNLDDAEYVYIGDSTIDPAGNISGTRLAPGQSGVFTTTAAIWADATAGTPSVGVNWTGV